MRVYSVALSARVPECVCVCVRVCKWCVLVLARVCSVYITVLQTCDTATNIDITMITIALLSLALC